MLMLLLILYKKGTYYPKSLTLKHNILVELYYDTSFSVAMGFKEMSYMLMLLLEDVREGHFLRRIV